MSPSWGLSNGELLYCTYLPGTILSLCGYIYLTLMTTSWNMYHQSYFIDDENEAQ